MILFFLPHELWIFFMRICGFYLCFMISWILNVEKQKLTLFFSCWSATADDLYGNSALFP